LDTVSSSLSDAGLAGLAVRPGSLWMGKFSH
jgi:hypothetical protein